MAKLIASSVVRGSQWDDSHGGIYLIDLHAQDVRQVIDCNTANIDWRGRGADRGFRGIAFYEDRVFIAASDELFAYDSRLKFLGSWKNPYLRQCDEISVYEKQVFLASPAYDSILAFDIGKQRFHWALYVERQEFRFTGKSFDPQSEDGPLMLNRLSLNSVVANRNGLYMAGLRTGGMLRFNGSDISMSNSLPDGTHNAQPHEEGVLFNDTEAGFVRYASPDQNLERAFPVPVFSPEKLTGTEPDGKGVAPSSFGRGLCVLDNGLVAAGSAPSTIAVHDLASGLTALTVVLSTDARNAIHGLEVWPFN
jgi:hypothetical protein